jgi:hypothetical protein
MICTGSPFSRTYRWSHSNIRLGTKNFPPLAAIGQSAFIVFPHRRFFADLNRQTLRTESFAYNKREERLNLVGRPPD